MMTQLASQMINHFRRLVMPAATIAVLASMPVASIATQVYVTRDADGNVIFSDRASADAEVHQVQELPTMPAFVAPSSERPSPRQTQQPASATYESLQILSPNHEANIPPGLAAELDAVVDVLPPLQEGHLFEVLVDGQVIGSGTSNKYAIDQLHRGQHMIEARVVNGEGEELIRSPGITVYIQRASRLN